MWVVSSGESSHMCYLCSESVAGVREVRRGVFDRLRMNCLDTKCESNLQQVIAAGGEGKIWVPVRVELLGCLIKHYAMET